MRGVVLVWSGLVAGGLALLSALRGAAGRRRARPAALGLAAASAALLAAGATQPAPTRRAGIRRTLLDASVPEWQFAERHEIVVRASAAAVEEAVRRVTARDIRMFRLLTWLRSPRLGRIGRSGDGAALPASGLRPCESILAPSPDEPILDVALRTGFWALAEDPGREVVVGTLVMRPTGSGLPFRADEPFAAGLSAEQFAALSEPGYAKGALNFRLVPEPGGRVRVTTETRVVTTDAATRRRFAAYWRVIYPGSALIRRMWLQAIRRRAEASARVSDRRS